MRIENTHVIRQSIELRREKKKGETIFIPKVVVIELGQWLFIHLTMPKGDNMKEFT